MPNDLPHSRFGFTASRKVGGAVQRNRARRLLREAVRLQMDAIRSGWDLVFVARPAIVTARFSEVEEACTNLLRRARLLRPADANDETTGSGADMALPAGGFSPSSP